jgi:hypothetical protein
MIRIEVVSPHVEERSGIKDGKSAYAFVLDPEGNPAKYPVACSIMLEKNDRPYQPGFYTLDPRSIYVGDFRRLELGRLKLLPESGPARKAA